MLSLSRRECELGGDHSGKTKEKDGQVTKLLTFELQDVSLDELELNAFLHEPHAWRSLYNDGPNGIEPFLKCFKALEFDSTIEGAYVSLVYGLGEEVMAFADARLSKIKLALGEHGVTKLSCKVTTAPVLDDTLPKLFELFGKRIECEIRGETPGAQQELPINKHGEGEQSEQPRKRGRGRPRKSGGEARAH